MAGQMRFMPAKASEPAKLEIKRPSTSFFTYMLALTV